MNVRKIITACSAALLLTALSGSSSGSMIHNVFDDSYGDAGGHDGPGKGNHEGMGGWNGHDGDDGHEDDGHGDGFSGHMGGFRHGRDICAEHGSECGPFPPGDMHGHHHYGDHHHGDDHTVVPLPASAWLFGSGLIGMASIMRRRNRKGKQD